MKNVVFLLALALNTIVVVAQTRYTSLCEDVSCNSETNYSFDLDGNGETDLRVTPGSVFGDLRYDQSFSNLGFIDYVLNSDGDVDLLSKNHMVSDTSKFSYLKSSKDFGASDVGSKNKYIGLRYKVSGVSPYYYGWMEVSYISADSMVVHSFGFSQNPSDSVMAGDIRNVVAIPVVSINVTSRSGDYAVNTNGGQLQMVVTLAPTNPTNCSVQWTINSKGGGANMDQNGLLTANKSGLIDVVATAQDASGIVGKVEVDVSPIAQVGLIKVKDILIYPNPTSDIVYVGNVNVAKIELLNNLGQIVKESPQNNMQTIGLSNGLYHLKVYSQEGQSFVGKILIQTID